MRPAEGLNLRRSVDGVRVTLQSGKWVWNASALRLVENRADILDNVPDHNQSFGGAGFNVLSPFWKAANFAVYYLGLDPRNSAFEKGRGRALQHTAGTHSWKTSRTWDYNYEAVLPWGSLLGGPISGRGHFQPIPATPFAVFASRRGWDFALTLPAGTVAESSRLSFLRLALPGDFGLLRTFGNPRADQPDRRPRRRCASNSQRI